MKGWIAWVVFLLCDIGAFCSVPAAVRSENAWSLMPGGGYVLAAEYHFGNKLQLPIKMRGEQ